MEEEEEEGEDIVPTPVGVNRYFAICLAARRNCPHTRGGEPVVQMTREKARKIVPTPVGVNRYPQTGNAIASHCPHTRGGEPV